MTETDNNRPEFEGDLTAPFWRGTGEGQVLVQRCENCQTLRWPPLSACPVCQHEEASWVKTSGSGVLWSYAIYHRQFEESFAEELPYAVGLLELDEGVRMVGLLGGPVDALTIGERMRVTFPQGQQGWTVPRWVSEVQEAGSLT